MILKIEYGNVKKATSPDMALQHIYLFMMALIYTN